MASISRRSFVAGSASAVAIGSLTGCAALLPRAAPRVVVVGGGYAGATCARYLRMWSDNRVDVTLVERNDRFVSCPLSNLVLGGSRRLSDITVGYDALERNHGVRRIRDEVIAIDPTRREVRVAGAGLPYDRLVVAPGVDMQYDAIPGLDNAEAQRRVLHAWKAGEQTAALRRQLEEMPDGGLFVIHVPRAPYRCPPAPYERACQVAWYFRNHKPKSKVLVLDANEDVQSKKALFMAAWNDRYKGLVEYRPNSTLLDVDLAASTAKLEFEDVKYAVLNVIPPQRAGAIARQLGMANANDRFCQVDFRTFESTVQPGIHVLGDAIQPAPAMPKSGHMANQHGKVAAGAIIAMLAGQQPVQEPVVANTCYSFLDDRTVVHVSSVHRYVAEHRTMEAVAGAGGLSAAPSELEAQYAFAWARNIWNDMLG